MLRVTRFWLSTIVLVSFLMMASGIAHADAPNLPQYHTADIVQEHAHHHMAISVHFHNSSATHCSTHLLPQNISAVASGRSSGDVHYQAHEAFCADMLTAFEPPPPRA